MFKLLRTAVSVDVPRTSVSSQHLFGRQLKPSPTRLLAALAMSMLVGCAQMDCALPSSSLTQDANALAASKRLAPAPITPAAWPTEKWWERYGDPQLNSLVEEAIAGSPSMRLAEARVRQAISAEGLAEAARLPVVSASARDTRQRFSEHSTAPAVVAGQWRSFNEATLNLSYEFDVWGKNRALYEAALDRVHVSEVDAQASRLLISSGVVQTYLRLAQAYEQRELAERILAQRQALLGLTQQRFAGGIDSEIELKQAESAVPSALQQVAAQRELIDITSNQLAALTGSGPDRGVAITRPKLQLDKSTALPSTVPADLVGRRPDVVAARWRVQASQKDVEVAKAQFMPNISLAAYAGFQSLGWPMFLKSSSTIAGIGPAVNLPIFDGGRLRSNLGLRNADQDVAIEQYNQTVIDALQDVVNQITSFQSVQVQTSQQQLAVASAQRAYDLSVQRYQHGLGTYLQALTAETQWVTQIKLLVDLQSRGLQLDAALIRSLGGGVPL